MTSTANGATTETSYHQTAIKPLSSQTLTAQQTCATAHTTKRFAANHGHCTVRRCDAQHELSWETKSNMRAQIKKVGNRRVRASRTTVGRDNTTGITLFTLKRRQNQASQGGASGRPSPNNRDRQTTRVATQNGKKKTQPASLGGKNTTMKCTGDGWSWWDTHGSNGGHRLRLLKQRCRRRTTRHGRREPVEVVHKRGGLHKVHGQLKVRHRQAGARRRTPTREQRQHIVALVAKNEV